jgi:hypothetical protein
LMSLGELDDPLLATWRTGLGIATAWTSDAKARWASHWIGWDRFADFWSDVVRETLPAAPSPGFSTRAISTDNGVEITVESESPLAEGARGSARVVEPDGQTTSVALSRSGPSSLRGVAQSGAAGAYLISVDVTAGGSPVYRDTVGSVRSYSAEYRGGDADDTLLQAISSATRGRFGINPGQSFDANLPAGRREIEVAPWLLLLAVLLLPLDIALRRVVITREDVAEARARARGWRPPWLRRSAPRTDRMDRLLRAKYRIRQAEPPSDLGGIAAPGAPEPIPWGAATPPEPPSDLGGIAAPGAPEPIPWGAATPPEPPSDEPPPESSPSPQPSDAAAGAAELLRRKRARKREGSS